MAGYNDWASEFNAYAPGRLCVLPVLPTHTPEGAIAELERVARLGHRGAIISPFELRCSDPAWDRLWAVAEETGLPISFHIGHGTSQVKIVPASWELAAFAAVGPMQLDEVLATFEEEPLGLETFMWAADYPHPDSTFPRSREAMAEVFTGLDAAFVEQVTATNCAMLYRLDRG